MAHKGICNFKRVPLAYNNIYSLEDIVMCQVCGSYPCNARCPNAPDPEVFARCEICGEPIYDGEDYYEIDGQRYCEDCVYDARKTAEVDY